MATLWNRATPSQYRMLRAIAGAVRNTAHAHRLEIPKSFARSVAKRATGTLTAQWPDVLAATVKRRQEGLRASLTTRGPRGSEPVEGLSEGDRLRLLRRSPIRALWKRYAAGMWKIKREGTPEQYAAHVRILQLLNQAQHELEALSNGER
jgi:hypothetical protein